MLFTYKFARYFDLIRASIYEVTYLSKMRGKATLSILHNITFTLHLYGEATKVDISHASKQTPDCCFSYSCAKRNIRQLGSRHFLLQKNDNSNFLLFYEHNMTPISNMYTLICPAFIKHVAHIDDKSTVKRDLCTFRTSHFYLSNNPTTNPSC